MSLISDVTRFASAAVLVVAAVGCTSRDPRAIAALTPELEPVVKGNNEFAINLYKKAAAKPGNLFFSPFSVSAALGMTYIGASGVTADEMKKVLSIEVDTPQYHPQFGALIADLGGLHEGRGYELRIANRLFGQKDFTFQKPFLDLTSSAYGAPLDKVDYRADPEVARATINKWVGEQTEGKIPELFQSGDVDQNTDLALANAIYFHADWKMQFDEDKTQQSTFTKADGTTTDVKLMFQDGDFRHSWNEKFSTVEMNYADDEISMILIVPEGEHTLAEVEADLSADALAAVLASAEESEVTVGLPRFQLDARLPLKELLIDMGMKTAFSPEEADFSAMADLSVAHLYLQAAVHQAFVKVDESGTEAAAATGVSSGVLSAPPQVVANRPFLFIIRDRLTSSILFEGRIEDPTGLAF